MNMKDLDQLELDIRNEMEQLQESVARIESIRLRSKTLLNRAKGTEHIKKVKKSELAKTANKMGGNPMFGAYLIAVGELVSRGMKVQDANDVCGGDEVDTALFEVFGESIATHCVRRMMQEGYDEIDVRGNLDYFWGALRSLHTPKMRKAKRIRPLELCDEGCTCKLCK